MLIYNGVTSHSASLPNNEPPYKQKEPIYVADLQFSFLIID